MSFFSPPPSVEPPSPPRPRPRPDGRARRPTSSGSWLTIASRSTDLRTYGWAWSSVRAYPDGFEFRVGIRARHDLSPIVVRRARWFWMAATRSAGPAADARPELWFRILRRTQADESVTGHRRRRSGTHTTPGASRWVRGRGSSRPAVLAFGPPSGRSPSGGRRVGLVRRPRSACGARRHHADRRRVACRGAVGRRTAE